MADVLLNMLVTLLVTIDPVGLAPLFVVLTVGRSVEARRRIANKAILTAFAILTGFALGGKELIGLLGISIPAFRISGGLLLFWIAFEMVFEQRRKAKDMALAEENERHDVAIFPLAVPLIAGPGAISATILLASQRPSLATSASLIAIVAIVLALSYGVFLLADPIDKLLGATGRTVLSRLLGVILAALAVQFVADGILVLAAHAG